MGGFSMDDLDDMPEELKELLIRKLKGESVDLDEEFDTEEKQKDVANKIYKGSEGALKAGQVVKFYSGVGNHKKLQNTALGKCHPSKLVLVKKMESGRDTELWLGWFQDKPEKKRMAWVHADHIVSTMPQEQFEHQLQEYFHGIQGEFLDCVANLAIEINKQSAIGKLLKFSSCLVQETLKALKKEDELKKLGL